MQRSLLKWIMKTCLYIEAEDSTEINGVTVTAKWNTRESGISADAKLHVEEVTEQSKDKVVEDIEAGKVAQLDPQENQIQDVVSMTSLWQMRILYTAHGQMEQFL